MLPSACPGSLPTGPPSPSVWRLSSPVSVPFQDSQPRLCSGPLSFLSWGPSPAPDPLSLTRLSPSGSFPQFLTPPLLHPACPSLHSPLSRPWRWGGKIVHVCVCMRETGCGKGFVSVPRSSECSSPPPRAVDYPVCSCGMGMTSFGNLATLPIESTYSAP